MRFAKRLSITADTAVGKLKCCACTGRPEQQWVGWTRRPVH